MDLFQHILTISIFSILFSSCEQEVSIAENDFTGINPLSYTDVVYNSVLDTVLCSTFDGKIKELIRDKDDNRLIIDLDDEIYSLAYDPGRKIIYASTLKSGVVVIDATTSEIKETLPLTEKWASHISYDPVSEILMTADYAGNSYVWDIKNNYRLVNIPREFSNMEPKEVSNGIVYFDGRNEVGRWDLWDNTTLPKSRLSGRIADIGHNGEILSLSHETFRLYDADQDSLLLEGRHPDWPIYVRSRDTIFRAPVSMHLCNAQLGKEYFYTAGIDRSIRQWNRKTGKLQEDFLGHKATVNALDLSNDESQLVTVDLKGGVRFWDVESPE